MEIQGYWLASGILGVTGSIMRRVARAGADAIVTKSIGPTPRTGHPGPIIAATHGGMINAVGLTNPGITGFEDEIVAIKKASVSVVLSIFGSNLEEITWVAEKGIDYGPDAIEVNLSCPHAEIGLIAHHPDTTYEYVKAIKDTVDCPVYAKITPNASDYVAVAKAAERAGADAIVAINTLRAMKIDIHQRRPVLGNLVGGLSGPPVFPVAVRCVYDLYKALSIPIIGVGGVTYWKDAVEMHLAGASAIQIGTAVLSGIDVFQKIKDGVARYLKDKGLKDVKSIIGAAAED